MKHTLRHAFAILALAMAASAVSAATVTVSESTASTATLAFADHAGARLGLYMAYDSEDRGDTTNGWANVDYLGTVEPGTDTFSVSLPTGWGTGDKMAARFFLLSFPVERTLDYIESTGQQYLVPCPDHTPTGAAEIELKIELLVADTTTRTIFCARENASSKQFTLLTINSRWRFDYNGSTGTSKTPTADPVVGVPLAVKASSAGLYVDGTRVQEAPASAYATEAGGRLLLFALATGNGTPSNSNVQNNKFKLYAFKLTDGDFRLDMIPAVKGGVAGLYDIVSGRFVSNAKSGGTDFTKGEYEGATGESVSAASAVLEAAAATEILFTDDSDVVDATDYRTALPGRKIGAGDLTFTGDSVFTNGFQVGNGKWILAEGSSFSSTNTVYVGSGFGADSCGTIVISNAVFNLGNAWINANAGANKGDNTTRVLIYGDDTVVRVGRVSLSKGELQVYGGTVTAIDETANPPYYGIALGSGTEACRLYGGTLVSQCVRFSGANAAFEWRGGTFRAYATVNGSFFQTIAGVTSPITKTRVGREGGAFDTAGYTVRITNNLVRLSGETALAYSRATSMTAPAFRKIGAGNLVFAGANTYVCATEVAAGTLRLETAALPTTGLVRLTGGTLAFHNNDEAVAQTVGNLVGTGTIANTGRAAGGTLSVTGEIVPGGPDGSLGPITVDGVSLSGNVVLRVASSGTIPSNIVNAGDGALDISGLAFSIENASNLPRDQSRIVLVQGPVTGTADVSGLPADWVVRAGTDGLTARAGGFVIMLR